MCGCGTDLFSIHLIYFPLSSQVLGQACYKEGKQIARDRMFDVPREVCVCFYV